MYLFPASSLVQFLKMFLKHLCLYNEKKTGYIWVWFSDFSQCLVIVEWDFCFQLLLFASLALQSAVLEQLLIVLSTALGKKENNEGICWKWIELRKQIFFCTLSSRAGELNNCDLKPFLFLGAISLFGNRANIPWPIYL